MKRRLKGDETSATRHQKVTGVKQVLKVFSLGFQPEAGFG